MRAKGQRAAFRFRALLALRRATCRDAIDPQQEHCADDREHDAPQREAFETTTGDEAPEETAEEGADDSNENGDNEPTGIIARHQRFRDRAGNETKHDPG